MAAKSRTTLLLSNEPWGEVWYSKQHYAWQLALLGHCVYFVDPPRKWQPRNLFSWKLNSEEITENLFVLRYRQNLPGLMNCKWMQSFHDFLLCWKLRVHLKKKLDIIWNFDPFRLSGKYFFKEAKYIYHVVDRYRFRSDLRAARAADLIPIVTKEYWNRYEKFSNKLVHIPHGIAEEDFHPSEAKVSKLTYAYGQYLLFLGTLHEGLDLKLLLKISMAFPAKKLVLVGPLKGTIPESDLFGEIKNTKNIVLVGSIPAKEINSYIRSAHICLIPYVMKQAYRAQTLKAIHYLAQEKPIVSIPLKDWDFLENKMVFSAKTHDKFIRNINQLLSRQLSPDPTASNAYLQTVKYPFLIKRILDELEKR